jgi:hypothetical protein
MKLSEQVLVVSCLSCFTFDESFLSVAENSHEAREILSDLFTVHEDVNDLEMTRHLIIELCVSVFHGLSAPSPQPDPSANQYQRQSKLGTVPLPPGSSVPSHIPPPLFSHRSPRFVIQTILPPIPMTNILILITLKTIMRKKTLHLTLK